MLKARTTKIGIFRPPPSSDRSPTLTTAPFGILLPATDKSMSDFTQRSASTLARRVTSLYQTPGVFRKRLRIRIPVRPHLFLLSSLSHDYPLPNPSPTHVLLDLSLPGPRSHPSIRYLSRWTSPQPTTPPQQPANPAQRPDPDQNPSPRRRRRWRSRRGVSLKPGKPRTM